MKLINKSFRSVSFLALFLGVFSSAVDAKSADKTIVGNAGSQLNAESYGEFNRPWAMTFLPSGDLLVTEKSGALLWVRLSDGTKEPQQTSVLGVPKVAYGGQGGLGDIILHPQYKDNHWVYLSYAEQDEDGNKGAVVVRAKLRLPSEKPVLEDLETVWKQMPKTSGSGHYSHRLAFSNDGFLFITSGDRQQQTPAQSWKQNLGKVIRLNEDGTVPIDNPFQNKGELAKSFWSTGHRNLLGIAFDKQGKLWTHEMGPRHGDEFNMTVAGENYGWPLVSWGDNYSGSAIPDHDTRPEFNAPEAYWVPSVAPSGLIIYNGSLFPKWQSNAFLGGLRSQALVRMQIEAPNSGEVKDGKANEVERFDMGNRIREVEQGPKGAIWVLEDGRGANLLRLTPKK